MNVMIATGINNRNVSNIFNLYQNVANNDKIPPKPKWNPSALNPNGKLETLTPNLIHRPNKINNGAAQRAVKTSETKRGGRLSG